MTHTLDNTQGEREREREGPGLCAWIEMHRGKVSKTVTKVFILLFCVVIVVCLHYGDWLLFLF